MSRPQLLWLLDRAPRAASLLGLLGLVGLAGLVRPDLFALSFLSFLSYLAFFRFFRRFLDPAYGPTPQSTPFLLPAFAVLVLSPWLLPLSPAFGFFGFAGWCALYEPTRAVRQPPAA
ncbi:MAG: hypothetical protein HGA45_08265 [Chloroflexales bacterium]|nr:hypothetical protein [Chloroflexales bacterium]